MTAIAIATTSRTQTADESRCWVSGGQ
jgi:hypothetical protein